MLFTFLAGVENGRFSRWKCSFFPVPMSSNTYSYSYPSWGSKWAYAYLKKVYFSRKMFFLKLNFQDESHLHANCLFCILILCCKCFSFQFLSCGICKHISILMGAQNGRIYSWKNMIFFWKMFFLKFNFQDKDQLYANCLFHILSLYCKCFLFQFLIGCIFTS